jgi:hypothetical protein
MEKQNTQIATSITDPNLIKFFKLSRDWLASPCTTSFFNKMGKLILSHIRYQISDKTIIEQEVNDEIILIQQFFVHSNPDRHKEIKETLSYNVHNKSINQIVLLNERIYTDKELGISSEKIKQIIINKRLTYADVFNYVQTLGNDKYIILSNSDIFFDATINRIKISGLTTKKKLFSLLRYEYKRGEALKKSALFGPRPDSQDTWIWHSKWKIPENSIKILNIELGRPGCDNKIIYILNILGFACFNEPVLIKSYHHHTTNIRNYTQKNAVELPHHAIFPVLTDEPIANPMQTFDIIRENNNMRNYLEEKMKFDKPFVIPRIAGIENEVAMAGAMADQQNNLNKDIFNNFKNVMPVMKKNAGIRLDNMEDIALYSKKYLEPFHKSEIYAWLEPWSNDVKYIPRSFDFMIVNFPKNKIDSFVFDIFHNIHNNPWTLALRGKRILIISDFIESIKEKISIRDKIYGIELFPDCEFVFLKPPQTHGNNSSRKFELEFNDFVKRINDIKDTFDIALCSCGGYGNPICGAIYNMGKSAIYVGGVLQMYFGIYGERWLKERPDIMRLYLNQHWSRPKESERPKIYKELETI